MLIQIIGLVTMVMKILKGNYPSMVAKIFKGSELLNLCLLINGHFHGTQLYKPSVFKTHIR